jgi:hypothetical protein
MDVHARRPASEPLESRDLELGAALRTWVESHEGAADIQPDGPLEAIGMDPTWVLNMRTPRLEASILLSSTELSWMSRPFGQTTSMKVHASAVLTA